MYSALSAMEAEGGAAAQGGRAQGSGTPARRLRASFVVLVVLVLIAALAALAWYALGERRAADAVPLAAVGSESLPTAVGAAPSPADGQSVASAAAAAAVATEPTVDTPAPALPSALEPAVVEALVAAAPVPAEDVAMTPTQRVDNPQASKLESPRVSAAVPASAAPLPPSAAPLPSVAAPAQTAPSDGVGAEQVPPASQPQTPLAQAAQESQTPQISIQVHQRGEPSTLRQAPAREAASAADPLQVRQQVAALESAIASQNREAGQAAIRGLQSLLAAESITLQRYQAWWAMSQGDDAVAYQHYAGIADRLPGDQNAGLNLALLDWRAGRKDAARQRMGLLRLREPDSALIERQWRAMNERER